jgi:hypothetical protein
MQTLCKQHAMQLKFECHASDVPYYPAFAFVYPQQTAQAIHKDFREKF